MVKTINVGGRNIIVLGKTTRYARHVWSEISKRYSGFNKVFFVADQKGSLAGLNPLDTVIIELGQTWKNPIYETFEFQFLKDNGAVFIQEK
ncbi:hypothetical protein [Bacillus amyloliquefaciens]|uniref:hypothetical protein n=1 Tax=Bacillus amyloliquefaciens TaxID=1390 RepID=UPI002DC00242|nr:hypothetical protein [Bacillus amyloliquefaciens]MEC3841536.1 hypothetical protein [Bacillus amyloliquefaciens]